MNNISKPVRILSIILLIASCRESTRLSEQERASIIEDVRQTLESYCNDIRTSGLQAEFKYLDSSENFFWVPPGYPGPVSYDSVTAVLKQNAAKFKSVDNSYENLLIIPLHQELASYSGRLRSKVIEASSKTTNTLLVETGVLIKRKDGWKLLSGQTSVLNP